jgi:hypothetical protein
MIKQGDACLSTSTTSSSRSSGVAIVFAPCDQSAAQQFAFDSMGHIHPAAAGGDGACLVPGGFNNTAIRTTQCTAAGAGTLPLFL